MPGTFYQQQLEKIKQECFSPEYLYVRIRQSKLFIDNHFNQNIDLAQISESAQFSKYHFLRNFKRVYGLTPRQYLRDVRMQAAKKLLKTKLSVSEVCYSVGYDSLSTFSRAFKKGTGMSPMAYQQQNKAI